MKEGREGGGDQTNKSNKMKQSWQDTEMPSHAANDFCLCVFLAILLYIKCSLVV